MKICRARPQLLFTFYNWFNSTGWAVPQSVRYRIFRLQASNLSATSHTGRKSCRIKSLYMKRFWPGHMGRDGGDRQSSLSHVPQLDVSLVGSCQHSAPGSTPSHVGRSHLNAERAFLDVIGTKMNAERAFLDVIWTKILRLLLHAIIWTKILRLLLHAIHKSPPPMELPPPLWFSWTWDFHSNSWKWAGAWPCLLYLFG